MAASDSPGGGRGGALRAGGGGAGRPPGGPPPCTLARPQGARPRAMLPPSAPRRRRRGRGPAPRRAFPFPPRPWAARPVGPPRVGPGPRAPGGGATLEPGTGFAPHPCCSPGTRIPSPSGGARGGRRAAGAARTRPSLALVRRTFWDMDPRTTPHRSYSSILARPGSPRPALGPWTTFSSDLLSLSGAPERGWGFSAGGSGLRRAGPVCLSEALRSPHPPLPPHHHPPPPTSLPPPGRWRWPTAEEELRETLGSSLPPRNREGPCGG